MTNANRTALIANITTSAATWLPTIAVGHQGKIHGVLVRRTSDRVWRISGMDESLSSAAAYIAQRVAMEEAMRAEIAFKALDAALAAQ